MTDVWELLKKMDCEECSVHDDCDNENLCAEWITKAKPELLKLKEKAWKWDLLDKIGGPPKGDARIQWHIDMCDLRIKIGAVKDWYEAQINRPFASQWNLPDLQKVLWGSEFTTNSEEKENAT